MPREDRDYRSSRDDERRRDSWGMQYSGRGDDERMYRSRGRDDDEDRDRLGRRRGGWFGDPERHAEVSRRTFEEHARAFGLPEDERGGGRPRRRDEDEERGYRA